jgi:hypothetical protein
MNDVVDSERLLIHLFKNKYKQRMDLGNEYFQGNVEDMMIDMFRMKLG